MPPEYHPAAGDPNAWNEVGLWRTGTAIATVRTTRPVSTRPPFVLEDPGDGAGALRIGLLHRLDEQLEGEAGALFQDTEEGVRLHDAARVADGAVDDPAQLAIEPLHEAQVLAQLEGSILGGEAPAEDLLVAQLIGTMLLDDPL